MIHLEKIQEIVSHRKFKVFSKKKGIELVFLFGSVAKGTQGQQSDVDIAIVLDRDVSPKQYSTIQIAVMNFFGEALAFDRIDVVVMNKAYPLLSYIITQDGKCLYGTMARSEEVRLNALKIYDDHKPLYAMQAHYQRERARLGYLARKPDSAFFRNVRSFVYKT